MNEAFPDLLYNGIILCLDIQLIIIGLFKLLRKDKRDTILGVFCIIIGTSFIYNMYWPFFRDSAFYSILLANYKDIYLSPLLYLYIALLRRNNKPKILFRYHLFLPTVIFISYSLIKHVFKDFYLQNRFIINDYISIILLLFSLFYLIKGYDLFKKIKSILKPAITKKYKLFYYCFLFYHFQLYTYSLIVEIFNINIEFDTFLMLNRLLFMPLGLIINIVLLLFVISESNKLKSFFLEKALYINQELIEEKSIIKEQIELHFHLNKLYKNPNLKISDAASTMGINNKLLSEFIKNEYKTNFIDFVNGLRIEEFKNQLKSSNSRRYSLMGIAEHAGFKSRATFYRAFKKKEGNTPKEYLVSLNHTKH